MTKRQIEFLEYLSLGLSAWGAIAASISQEYAYAVLPLTLSVGLNLFNQQRERKLRQLSLQRESVESEPHNRLTPQQIEQLHNLRRLKRLIHVWHNLMLRLGKLIQPHKNKSQKSKKLTRKTWTLSISAWFKLII